MIKGRKILAASSMKSISGDAEANLDTVRSICEKAYKENVDLICFPELALSGADTETLGMKLYEISQKIPGRNTDALSVIAQSSRMYIVIGLPQKSLVPGRLFNTQVLITPEGKISKIYPKSELAGMELLYFKGNIMKKPEVIELPCGRCGLLVGTDILNEELVKNLIDEKIEILLISTTDEKEVFEKAEDISRKYKIKVLAAGTKKAAAIDAGNSSIGDFSII